MSLCFIKSLKSTFLKNKICKESEKLLSHFHCDDHDKGASVLFEG